MAAYEAAKISRASKAPIGANRTIPGTVNAAVVSYSQSSAFCDSYAWVSVAFAQPQLLDFQDAEELLGCPTIGKQCFRDSGVENW